MYIRVHSITTQKNIIIALLEGNCNRNLRSTNVLFASLEAGYTTMNFNMGLALVRNVAFTLHFGAKLLAFCVAVRCLL
jgi:hypothetical protein